MRRASSLALALVCFAWACGSPPGTGPRETGEASEEASSSEAETETTSPLCVPGAQRCASGGEGIETCDATGFVWELNNCGGESVCVECLGDADPLCEGLELRCSGPCDPNIDAPDSRGCNFVTAWLPWGRIDSRPPQHLVVTNPDPERSVPVRFLEIPVGTREPESRVELELAPLESETFEIPPPSFALFTSTLKTGAVWRVESDRPVVATQQAYPVVVPGLAQGWTGGSMLLLPEFSLRGDFVVTASRNRSDEFQSQTGFVIVSLDDHTHVQWVPPFASAGDGLPVPFVAAGATGSIFLNRYDQLYIASSESANPVAADRTLFGTVVSTDKRVAAFAVAPNGGPQRLSRSADTGMEQMIPIEYWGRTYVLPPVFNRSTPEREEGLNVRVVAGSANTEVFELSGAGLGTLELDARGDFTELTVAAGQGLVLTSDAPFSLVHFLETRRFNEDGGPGEFALALGDSAMTQVVPVEQFLRRYAFPLSAQWHSYVFDLVRPQGGPAVIFSGTEVEGWQSLGDYEWARVEVPGFEATAFAESQGPFGLTIYAHGDPDAPVTTEFGQDVSAAHPAGLGVVQLSVP